MKQRRGRAMINRLHIEQKKPAQGWEGHRQNRAVHSAVSQQSLWNIGDLKFFYAHNDI
jgi:hypothetical protein